jgi:hypothetical protein
MQHDPDRRAALVGLGVAAGTAVFGSNAVHAMKASNAWMPEAAATLRELHAKLEAAPRRRDFKTVPFLLEDENYWDYEALAELIAYSGGPKQIWDTKDLGGPWLNLMRNNLNVQVYSFKRPDFMIVSATHASAHLAMYEQAMWEKYQLSKLAGPRFPTNTLILDQRTVATDTQLAFSPNDNSIPALQRRGAVFFACHNSIWEQAAALIRNGVNPDGLSHEALAAELTNHLIPDVVLTPGAVATLLRFQEAGYHYAT